MNVTENELKIMHELSWHYIKFKRHIKTSLSEGVLTRTLRKLKTKGFARLDYAFTEEGFLVGSGYILTNSGAALCGTFGEDAKTRELEKIKSMREPEKITPKKQIFMLEQKIRELENKLKEKGE